MEQLGRYRLVTRISAGGMGELFLARQEGPAGFVKTVAIKRLLPRLARDLTFVELFLNEARLAALLAHPNVVQIFDLGDVDGSYFIAMEYIHGKSLRSLLAKSTPPDAPPVALPPLSAPLAAYACAQAARGLHHAHKLKDDKGRPLEVVHRDISPENILVSFEGAVKVVDFGLARAAQRLGQGAGLQVGKLKYMAPEQVERGNVGPRTDIYGLGVVLYELLTGVLPFTPDSLESARKILQSGARPRPPSELVPDLPPALDDVVLQALARAPEERFSSAEQFSRTLERIVTDSDLPTSPAEMLATLMRERFPDDLAHSYKEGEAPTGTAVLASAVEGQASRIFLPPTNAGDAGATLILPPERSAHGLSRSAATQIVTHERSAQTLSGDYEDEAPALASSDVVTRSLLFARRRPGLFFIGLAVLLGLGTVLALSRSQPPEAEPSAETATAPAAAPTNVPQRPSTGPLPTASLARAPAVTASPGATPATANVKKPAGTGLAPPATESEPELELGPPVRVTERPAAERSPLPPAERRRSTRGKLHVLVNPWAEVRVDGRKYGMTPLPPIELESGSRLLELVNPELGVSKKVRVRVKAGRTASVKVDLLDDVAQGLSEARNP